MARANSSKGPSERQLRAGELIRHTLVDILMREELHDEVLSGQSITIGEVRMSPDLRHAKVYCAPLGGWREEAPDKDNFARALNRSKKFLRGILGKQIALKFTPELHFIADESFDEASHMDKLFQDPKVAQDLASS